MVPVRVFDQTGKLVGPVNLPQVELSDAEWQQKLTAEQFRVLRHQGTERAFCGNLLDNKQEGVYTCAGCGLPLFSSQAKFNSGTGWPSFFQPVAVENVLEHNDFSYGMIRTEITCARCGGHLGHVFPDGPLPTGRRFCLNSESLYFTPADQLASLADPGAETFHPTEAREPHAIDSPPLATAVFAGGCFWCTEAAFEQLDGVLDVESGYAGGGRDTADYEQVSSGQTGHAEVIKITYNPQRISYDHLLNVFFDAHDPTQLNRQGNDVGSQYRSAIFVASDKEKRAAEDKIEALNQSAVFSRPIVTTVETLKEFFPAEQYHQDYARQHPNQPYIQYHAMPKACEIREKHPNLIRRS